MFKNSSQYLGIFIHEGVTEVKPLFRGTRSEPKVKFEEGFTAKGSNTNLMEHIQLNPKDSNYISTSDSKGSCTKYCVDKITKKGFIYEINPMQGAIDVQPHLDKALKNNLMNSVQHQKHSFNREFSVPDRIHGKDIKGAWEITEITATSGKTEYILGDQFIPNPEYKMNLPVKVAQGVKYAGRGLLAVGVAADGYNLYQAFEQSQTQDDYQPFFAESARIFAGWTAAAAMGASFAKTGAAAGVWAGGPIGGVVGGTVMGVVGSVTGYMSASHLVTESLKVDEKPEFKPHETPPEQPQEPQQQAESKTYDQPKPQSKPKSHDNKQGRKEKMKTTRQEFFKEYKIKEQNLSSEQSGRIDELLNNLEQTKSMQDYAEKVQSSKEFFLELHNFALTIDNPKLARFSRINYEGVKITENLQKLQGQFPALNNIVGPDSMLGGLLSGISSLGPYMAIISSIGSIAMSLFGRSKTDPVMEMNKAYFEAILSSLNEIRKEIRQLGVEMNALFKSLKFALELVYHKLKFIILMNQEDSLSNIYHLSETQKEDHQQLSKVLSALIQNSKLNDLYSKLSYVQDKNVTDAELRPITVEIPKTWLELDLVGHAYNGGVFSTDSTRQNSIYVGEGIDDISAALGFMANYAVNEQGLNLAAEFSKIDSKKLPMVPVWIYTMNAYLLGLSIVAKRNKTVIDITHLNNLIAIVDNTLNFIQTSADNSEIIFDALIGQYLEALESLYDSLEEDLKNKMIISDKTYSVSDAVDYGFLSIDNMNRTLGTGLTKKILNHEQALEPKISTLAFLGNNLEDSDLEFNLNAPKFDEPITWEGDKCDKGKTKVWGYTEGIAGGFAITHAVPQRTRSILTGTYHKPRELIDYGCHAKDWSRDAGVKEKKAGLMAEYDKYTEHQHLAKASVHAFSFIEGANELINAALAKNLSSLLISSLKAGNNFTHVFGPILSQDCDSLFAQAVKHTQHDSHTNAQIFNTLAVTQAMAKAFAELIGVPDEIVSRLKTTMIKNAGFLLKNPAYLDKIKTQLSAVKLEILDSMPNRVSAVEDLMLAARDLLQDALGVGQSQQAYLDNLAEWRTGVEFYAGQQMQIDAMQKIGMRVEPETYTDLAMSYNLLKRGREFLVETQRQFSLGGYDYFPVPEALDTLISQAKSMPKNKTKSSSATSNDLTFSIPKAIRKGRETVAYMKRLPRQSKPACVQISYSGPGKSSKTNYILGTDYELAYDDEGQAYAKPINGVKERTTTGYGGSITKFVQLIEAEGCVYADFPGSSDDEGSEADISRSMQIQMLPNIFDEIKVIELIATASHVYDGRFSLLAKTFREGGLMIANNPEVNAKNILITITKGSLYSSGKISTSQIFKKLQGWYDKNIKDLDQDDENYPIRYVLENIQEDQILLVDVINPSHRQNYLDRVKKFQETEISQFNFAGLDKNAVALDNFEDKLHNKFIQNNKQIEVDKQNLKRHWYKQHLLNPNYVKSSFPSSQASLNDFEAIQEQQHLMLAKISTVLNPIEIEGVNARTKVSGDTQDLVQRIVDLTAEQHESGPLLDNLQVLLDPDQEQDFPLVAELCTPSDWSVPPVVCGRTLPGSFQSTPPESLSGIPEQVPDYLGFFNAQLMFFRMVWHLGAKALGYEQQPAKPAAFVGHLYKAQTREPVPLTTNHSLPTIGRGFNN